MKQIVELLQSQKIDDLTLELDCKDEFINSLDVDFDIAQDYFDKAEELFTEDKSLAFKYYKLAYKNNYWLAPYMLGIYFEYGIDRFVKSNFLALEFYKESINRGDLRGYPQIADLIEDKKQQLILWKKFFTHEMMKEVDYKLKDFANYNIDYRAIFLYKFKNEIKYENEIREILDIIKPTIIRDFDEIISRLRVLLDDEISEVEEDIFNDIIHLVTLVKNSNEDELFILDEDMTMRLEKLIDKDKKWN